MMIGEVVGHVVATAKHDKLTGQRMMLVRPVTPAGADAGTPVMAIDTVGALAGTRNVGADRTHAGCSIAEQSSPALPASPATSVRKLSPRVS